METHSTTHGIYVHVPWCRARCPYCAFYVVPEAKTPDWRPFVERVLSEHRQRQAIFCSPAQTVFFGGGTPSRLPPEAFAALLDGLGPASEAEISAEVNPEDISDDWLRGVIAAGVCRLSLGVQSLRPKTAGRLGRAHTQRCAQRVLEMVAASALRSWSADLVFAVPGQSEQDLWEDIEHLLAFHPPHVSLYGLTLEPGTRFARAAERGKLVPCDEDRYCTMYEGIVERLAAAGLERYEISNFARAGHRCRHNQLYWTDAPYIGLGPSAHGYTPSGERWVNVSDLQRYLSSSDPTEVWEAPTAQQAAIDLYVSGLRAADGVDLDHLAARTGLRPSETALATLIGGGLTRREGARLMLTPRGVLLCDAIVKRLAESSEPA